MTESSDPMQEWQSGALGRALIGAEAKLLSGALNDVFGLELLQLGTWGIGHELLSGCRVRRQSLLVEAPLSADGDICANLTRLPIGTGLVDAVLLPHTLELAADPHAVLREADRVLGADGQLLVLGFRPLSLWGLRATAMRSGYPPGLRRTLPQSRVRDWLVLLGYEVVLQRYYLYRLPLGRRSGVADEGSILRRGWFYPWPAAAYLIKARKRLYTLTPIRPRPQWLKLPGGLVEPSA